LGRQHPGGGTGGSPAGGASSTSIDLIDWDGVFASFCHRLGWSWDTAEAQLDLHRLQAFQRHWRDLPDLPTLVAAYIGYKPPVQTSAPGAATPEVQDMAHEMGNLPVRHEPLPDSTLFDAELAKLKGNPHV
jgi:hypothetical protein